MLLGKKARHVANVPLRGRWTVDAEREVMYISVCDKSHMPGASAAYRQVSEISTPSG